MGAIDWRWMDVMAIQTTVTWLFVQQMFVWSDLPLTDDMTAPAW